MTKAASRSMGYENLEVYRYALEFVRYSAEFAVTLNKKDAELENQLKRASRSIPLNIAEGNGKTSGRDQRRYYAIARGSANECGAALDVAHTLGFISDADFARGKDLLISIAAMLTTMCNS